jgi:signal transduction histidine kinase
MKKIYLLQILYVICAIALLSLLWEFVAEEFFSLDEDENNYEKLKDVLATMGISLLALAYPAYKGLIHIHHLMELKNTLRNQGSQLDGDDLKKVGSTGPTRSKLTDGVHRIKKIEDAINSERKKFFNMLDQLPVSFHLQAADYSIPFANKMFRERFGPPDKGKCFQVMHKRSEPCQPCPTFKVFDSRRTESSTWTTQDGKTYLTVVTPFEEMNGDSLLMEMAIDISSEQKAKEDLRQALDEQEVRIMERTLKLERSNNSLKEFTSFAAHDLQEPLRKIKLFSDRIQEVLIAEPGWVGEKYLEGIQRSTQRMNLLIEDLLRLSQITSQETDLRQLDLNILLAEVVEDLEPSYPGSSKSIFAQSLPKVEADKTQMYQLFKNLLSNSLKYAKAEEPANVKIEVETDSDQNYVFSVQDNGIGFDEKYKGKIFKPFERLHGRNQYSGTGIGLAICKKVVESHNGELDVKSQLDVGTTFTIRLPKPTSAKESEIIKISN